METNQVMAIVTSVVTNYLQAQDITHEVSEDTVLFGEDAILDSMGLVNVIVDLESDFLEAGYKVSLMSDVAMSRRQSPFRTVSTVAKFIDEQINGNN